MAYTKIIFGPQGEVVRVSESVYKLARERERAEIRAEYEAPVPIRSKKVVTKSNDEYIRECFARQVNPYAILAEAYAILHAEGLLDWRVVLDDDPVNAGTCVDATKTITLSPRWMTSVAEGRDTVLHEISHAKNSVEHHGTGFNAVLHEMRHKHNRVD